MPAATTIRHALPVRCRRGIAALEYGLIAGLIAGAGKLGSTMASDVMQGAAFIGTLTP